MGRKLYLLENLNLKKGDIFKFGSWMGKPIEWQVLEDLNDSLFCISKESVVYSGRLFDFKDSSYKESDLRKWIVQVFYRKAFDSKEKSFLLRYYPEGNDKVTILSEEEAKECLPSKSDRETDVREEGWWLRSPGDYSDTAFYVDSLGNFYQDHIRREHGVRPVIHLKKDVENFLDSEEV